MSTRIKVWQAKDQSDLLQYFDHETIRSTQFFLDNYAECIHIGHSHSIPDEGDKIFIAGSEYCIVERMFAWDRDPDKNVNLDTLNLIVFELDGNLSKDGAS